MSYSSSISQAPEITDWHVFEWGDGRWMRSNPVVQLSSGRKAIIGRHCYCGYDRLGEWTPQEQEEAWKAVSALFDIHRPRR